MTLSWSWIQTTPISQQLMSRDCQVGISSPETSDIWTYLRHFCEFRECGSIVKKYLSLIELFKSANFMPNSGRESDKKLWRLAVCVGTWRSFRTALLFTLSRGHTEHANCCYCSVTKSCLTLCDPMERSMASLPVPHHLLEFAQVHVHWIGDANYA